jgi:hypothetical protein
LVSYLEELSPAITNFQTAWFEIDNPTGFCAALERLIIENTPALKHLAARMIVAIEQRYKEPPKETEGKPSGSVHKDGPEGGRWVWWQGKQHNVPTGTAYRLIAHMWTRDFAKYDDLFNGTVYEDTVQPDSIRGDVSKLNKRLKRIGITWCLCCDSRGRTVTKRTIKRES